LISPDLSFFFAALFSPCPLPSFFSLDHCFFFWNFIFSLPPTQFLFFFLPLKLFPPTDLLPPLSPTDLLTYTVKMCYSHPHPPNRPSIVLPTNTLSRYLPKPAYMATPTYMVAIPIDLQQSTMMRKE
jgi:hypothetical protein